MEGLSINLRGEQLVLLAHRAVYWPDRSCLFLADLHLGKARHFRKEGIGVPEAIGEKDYSNLYNLLKEYPVDSVYFLGDLFHSEHNKEWKKVEEVVKLFPKTTFTLILGNHDILNLSQYEKAGLVVYEKFMDIGPFQLMHEPPEDLGERDKFIFCGHIHPGIGIKGKGRQYIRLPCFYSCDNYMILPAYGTFTGLKTLTLSGSNIAYAILKDKVIPIKESYSKRKKSD